MCICVATPKFCCTLCVVTFVGLVVHIWIGEMIQYQITKKHVIQENAFTLSSAKGRLTSSDLMILGKIIPFSELTIVCLCFYLPDHCVFVKPAWHILDHPYDDAIKWKHFPRYWPFVRGIHRSQSPVTRSFGVTFDLRLNKLLIKQLWGWWFETLSRPLWRHCNAI